MPTKNGSALTPALESVDVSTLRIVSIEDILAADDLPTKTIPVPEWGGAVVIKGFSKAVEMEIRRQAGGAEDFDSERFEMLMFVYGVIEPQFTVEQLDLLKEKNSAPFDRVLSAVMDLAGLTKEAKERAKAGFPKG
jgi:hypothetical protein